MLRRFTDFITVTLFGLILTTPLWSATAVPCTHDGHLHYHRIAALKHAWENGLYFTRWLPDLAFGYGYPFFIYREAPPLYLPFGFHLSGLSLPAAENLTYGLWLLAAGWFMYLWVRDLFGRQAGVVAAVAYMASPYLLVDTMIRGNSPEALALPLFPLILWASRRFLNERLSITRYQLQFPLAVFSLALLSLSHNISTLIFAPTLLVYLIILAWVYRLHWQTAVFRIGLLFVLGFGVTLFYTGGALLELDQVTLEQSTTTRNNDFRYNFASWQEIFAPVSPEDPALLNPPLPFRLGWVPSALALVGIIGWFVGWLVGRKKPQPDPGERAQQHLRSEQSAHILMMGVATAVYLFFALPLSQPVWELLPLIDFVQFPWRFVGRAALPVAMLAGVLFSDQYSLFSFQLSEKTQWINVALLGAALLLLLLETIPNLYPGMCVEAAYPTINNVHRYEQETGLVGVDPEGSYFPRSVKERPSASPLLSDYAAGQTPQRFDGAGFPLATTIHSIDYGHNEATLHLTTPQPFVLRYFTFDFPGWTATVDGQSVPITASDPEGLITVPVAAGEHTVLIRWQLTPVRRVLALISGLALVAVVGCYFLFFGKKQLTEKVVAKDYASLLPGYRLLFLLPIALLGFKLLVVDRVETPLRHTGAPEVMLPTDLHGAGLQLDGFNLSQTAVAAGDTFDVDMAWKATSPPAANYQTNVWLEDSAGLLWSDKETYRPRLYEDVARTLFWQPGQWAWDSREVWVLPGTPPGTYDLVLTLFDRETLVPVTLSDVNGAVVGPTAIIGQIEVTWPDSPVGLTPQYRFAAPLAMDNLTLLGYSQDRATAVPGDPVLVTLFWEARADAPQLEIPLRLVDNLGTVIYQELVLLSPIPVGQQLRQQILLRLPAATATGLHQFILGDEVELGNIEIAAPERLLTPPVVSNSLSGIIFNEGGQDLVGLTGYELIACETDLCQVRLVWKALAETAVSYRIFVHLVDANGQLITQSDGEPANWRRPTTGWARGEYIVDDHTLALPSPLPAGAVSVRVGLYDPQTGERLMMGRVDFATIPWDVAE